MSQTERSLGDAKLDFQFTQPQTKPVYKKVGEGPLRVLVLGDFSGRENRGSLEHGDALAARPIVSVDVDNFENVLYGFAPRLSIVLGDAEGAAVSAEFKDLDDFHPDALHTKLDVFQELRAMRDRVSDPATLSAEAQGLQKLMAGGDETADDAPSKAEAEDDSETLSRLLGRSPSERPQARTGAAGPPADLPDFIRRLVQPHVVPDVQLQQEQLIKSVDEATSAQMRCVLHDPAFQALEAAWRGVNWLVSEIDLGEEIKLSLLDVSKQELAADLSVGKENLSETGTYRAVVEATQTAGGEPWSIIVGLYEFGMAAEDFGLLAGLGTVAAQAGSTLLAGAAPSIIGCRRLVDAPHPTDWTARNAESEVWWQALRKSGVAGSIGLAAPRILLRLPYGERTDSADTFDFEELPDPAEHDRFLWGNPALACTMLIAAAFQERGWDARPGELLDLGDLPAFTYSEGGETKLKPVAEVLLVESAAQAMLDRGVMPLMSHARMAAVHLMRFQSIADPPRALAGPWR